MTIQVGKPPSYSQFARKHSRFMSLPDGGAVTNPEYRPSVAERIVNWGTESVFAPFKFDDSILPKPTPTDLELIRAAILGKTMVMACKYCGAPRQEVGKACFYCKQEVGA